VAARKYPADFIFYSVTPLFPMEIIYIVIAFQIARSESFERWSEKKHPSYFSQITVFRRSFIFLVWYNWVDRWYCKETRLDKSDHGTKLESTIPAQILCLCGIDSISS
jgi:hypothetical protein